VDDEIKTAYPHVRFCDQVLVISWRPLRGGVPQPEDEVGVWLVDLSEQVRGAGADQLCIGCGDGPLVGPRVVLEEPLRHLMVDLHAA